MSTELQSKYADLLHERMMDQEVICILLEALGGEYVLGDTTEIIEGTSNREFVTTFEPGYGYKLTLVYRPEKPGFMVHMGKDPEDIPEPLERGLSDIRPLTDEEREGLGLEEDE